MPGTHTLLPPWEAFPQAKAAAKKALALDESLAAAHTSLADARYHYDNDWVGAEEGFQRVFELDPGNATAHVWYSGPLTALGRFDEALAEVAIAQRLDPLSIGIRNLHAGCYYLQRDDDAIRESESALELFQG